MKNPRDVILSVSEESLSGLFFKDSLVPSMGIGCSAPSEWQNLLCQQAQGYALFVYIQRASRPEKLILF